MQNLVDKGIPMEFTKNLLSEDAKAAALSPSPGEKSSGIPTVIPPVETSKASLRQTTVEQSLAHEPNLDETHPDSKIQTDSTVLSEKDVLIRIPKGEAGETPTIKRGRGRPRKIRHQNEMKSHDE